MRVFAESIDTRFQVTIRPDEWSYYVAHRGRVSSVRVTDLPRVHLRDDHNFVAATPPLRRIGTLIREFEQRCHVFLQRATAPSSIPASRAASRSSARGSRPSDVASAFGGVSTRASAGLRRGALLGGGGWWRRRPELIPRWEPLRARACGAIGEREMEHHDRGTDRRIRHGGQDSSRMSPHGCSPHDERECVLPRAPRSASPVQRPRRFRGRRGFVTRAADGAFDGVIAYDEHRRGTARRGTPCCGARSRVAPRMRGPAGRAEIAGEDRSPAYRVNCAE
jgi:hypothetical protein